MRRPFIGNTKTQYNMLFQKRNFIGLNFPLIRLPQHPMRVNHSKLYNIQVNISIDLGSNIIDDRWALNLDQKNQKKEKKLTKGN